MGEKARPSVSGSASGLSPQSIAVYQFREGLPMELLYTDYLVLVAETEELLMEMLCKWKRGMELRSPRQNLTPHNLCLDKGYEVSGENRPG